MKTHNTRVSLFAITVVLTNLTFISNVSADINCSADNLSRLESENKESQRIIDTEPEFITFSLSDGNGNEIQSSYRNINRQIAELNLGVNKANLVVCKSEQDKREKKTKIEVVDENEGFEVEIEADILVKKLQGRYHVNVSSNIASGAFELLALKQGSKTIKFILETNEDGNAKFNTKRNLKGYRLVLKYNGEQINSYSIN